MFNFNFPFYSVMILLALISNVLIVFKLSKKYEYESREIICLLLYELVGIIGGAKILTFLVNYKELNGQFNFITLGFSSYGAVIGALMFIILFVIQFKKSFKELLYIFLPPIPLMYAIGKIGCFLTGCCYGIEYNGILKVIYKYVDIPHKNTYLFPVQIIETIAFLAIFIYVMIKHKRNEFTLKTIGEIFIFCGISKFILDFLRMSHANILISINQLISIVFILIGIAVYVYEWEKSRQI